MPQVSYVNGGGFVNRREFIISAAAVTAVPGLSGCRTPATAGGRILFGACRGPDDVKLMASVGYDFWEWGVGAAFNPDKDAEWWKAQRDRIAVLPLPLRSCNGFIPGRFRLTGPKADHGPALDYAETALRRADEVGVKTVVFGSGGARNVPGDYTIAGVPGPDVEQGVRQYTDFCRELCRRVSDLKTVQVVIEPLRPNESNIVNYVWQGVQICEDVASPRLAQLADIFHMMMGRESAASLVAAGKWLRHCHIASYGTRSFPGSDPQTVDRLRPYFDALRSIDYEGGVSCECGWGEAKDLAKNLETALTTMKS